MTTIKEYASQLETATGEASEAINKGNRATYELGSVLEKVYVNDLTIRSLGKKAQAALKGDSKDDRRETAFAAWYVALGLNKSSVSRKRTYSRKLTAIVGFGVSSGIIGKLSEGASRVIPEEIDSKVATAVEAAFNASNDGRVTGAAIVEALTEAGILEPEKSDDGKSDDGKSGGEEIAPPSIEDDEAVFNAAVNAIAALLEGGYKPTKATKNKLKEVVLLKL